MDEAGHPAASAGDAAGVAVAAHPRHQRLNAGGASRRRDRRQHFLVDDVLHARALHVDDRRFAGDGHGLFEAPTRRSALTVATKSPLSSMPSRFTVLKPGSVNVTA